MHLDEVLDALDGTAYAVDIRGRIRAVGRRHWTQFALENDAPELADPDNILGCELLGFIEGAEVREAYRAVMERARSGEPEVTITIRCDAPEMARLMRLVISPLSRKGRLSGYLFQCVSLEENLRPPLGLFAFRSHLVLPEQWPMISMCSLCECTERGGRWLSAEEYYATGGASNVRISHTICPRCFERWIADWGSRPMH